MIQDTMSKDSKPYTFQKNGKKVTLHPMKEELPTPWVGARAINLQLDTKEESKDMAIVYSLAMAIVYSLATTWESQLKKTT